MSTSLPMTTASAAAASAAVAVAAGFGVMSAEPVILSDGANVIVHLSPSPVVAKVELHLWAASHNLLKAIRASNRRHAPRQPPSWSRPAEPRPASTLPRPPAASKSHWGGPGTPTPGNPRPPRSRATPPAQPASERHS